VTSIRYTSFSSPTEFPHKVWDVNPAIQSPSLFDKRILGLQVARVRAPQNGFGANPVSWVNLYENSLGIVVSLLFLLYQFLTVYQYQEMISSVLGL